jgi:hypothetical protein
MSRFEFALAGPADDAQLRARMAADVMEGGIAVSFRREPSYFAGCRVQGDATQVVKCTDRATGRIVGLGSRSTAPAFVDGRRERIGYLADLRLAPELRRGTLLARGYRMLRRMHTADPVRFYTTLIYEGNARAERALVGARAGLPRYVDWGRLLTPALRLDFAVRHKPPPDLALRRGGAGDLPRIVEFLNRERAAKQFAPVVDESQFGEGRLGGLRPESFLLALRGGRIVGTLAAWDQSALRQTHVERYPVIMGALRPLYNALAAFSPMKPLPPPGARIPYVYLACAATEGNDVSVFRTLLCAMHQFLRRGPWSFAIAALHESDPLARALQDFRAIPAAGRLYVVHYPEEAVALDPVARRVPCLEAGCL